MRAYEGQRSDKRRPERSEPDLRLQLEELRGYQRRMKPHTNADLKQSVARRIASLERALER